MGEGKMYNKAIGFSISDGIARGFREELAKFKIEDRQACEAGHTLIALLSYTLYLRGPTGARCLRPTIDDGPG